MKTKIINYTFPNNTREIGTQKITIEYNQECDLHKDDLQTLKCETEDGGGGKYFVISTERWAFDDIDELILVLKDFKKKAGIK